MSLIFLINKDFCNEKYKKIIKKYKKCERFNDKKKDFPGGWEI
jgi:hypothetical protein